MNGGLTWRDLDILKAKAKAFDEALEYVTGRCTSEEVLRVERILNSAMVLRTAPPAGEAGAA